VLALFLAFAVATPTLFAQEWDHFNGRDKDHDPTGAWLINQGKPGFFLMVFHKGGTLTGERQGGSAFDPAAVTEPNSIFNVVTTTVSGVWQKTGWNTFAATFLAIEYRNITTPEPHTPLFRFDRAQMLGRLTDSGDGMTFTGLVKLFDGMGKLINVFSENGSQLTPFPFPGNGRRIPLEILPKSSDSLSVPIPPLTTNN
jgi:hypothetical protein